MSRLPGLISSGFYVTLRTVVVHILVSFRIFKNYFIFYLHLYFFFQVLGETLPYDTIQELRVRLNQVAPNLTRYGLVEEANFFAQAAEMAALQDKLAVSKDPIDVTQKILTDYYMTNSISRASPTMAKCVQTVKAHLDAGYKKE